MSLMMDKEGGAVVVPNERRSLRVVVLAGWLGGIILYVQQRAKT